MMTDPGRPNIGTGSFVEFTRRQTHKKASGSDKPWTIGQGVKDGSKNLTALSVRNVLWNVLKNRQSYRGTCV